MTPHFHENTLEKREPRNIISNCAATLPALPTLKHQMWFWSQEDVEPAANSWQGEVRPSVLQKCGDAAKPGKRTKTVTVLVLSTTGQNRGRPLSARSRCS